MKKLSNKILFAVFTGAALILITLSLLTFSFTKALFEQSIMENQLEIARQSMDKIDRMLNERVLNIQTIAGAPSIQNVLISGNIDTGDYRRIGSRRIEEFTAVTGPWDILLMADLNANIVISSEEKQSGKSLKEQPQNYAAYQAVMHKDFYYSDFVISENTGQPSIIFAAPVRNPDVPGRPVTGAVIGHFSWRAISQILDDVPVAAKLVNREGAVIVQNTGGNEDLFTQYAAPVIRENLKQGRSKSVFLKKEESMIGVKSLVSFNSQSGYLFYQGSGWGIVLEKPEKAVLVAGGMISMKLAVLLVPIVLIGALLMILMISQWVTKPIAALTETTRRIAEGDMTKRVSITGADEMGQLAISFNAMTEKLKKSHEDLEEQVNRRTEELVNINEALRRSETKNRLILETAHDAFLSINVEGIITEWNQKAELTFGWKREAVIGRPLAETIIPVSMREAHYKGLARYLQTGEGPVLNKRIALNALHRDGHEFPIEITIWPLQIGKIVNFNAFIQDITERKRLEHMVLQSEKMAAIGQLAGGVAHEINNPLGIILGFSQNIVKRVKPGDPFELPLKSIEREAVRCKNLVQDLLTFSRIGKVEKESIDLKEAIEGALSLVLAQSKIKNVELIKEFTEVPRVIANKNQIQQVIINLSNNAMDAMPKGGKLIIRLKKTKMEQQDGVEIQVADTGQGIPPEIRSKIFNPFFTTKDIGKGTGLGLSLVYEIVEKHQGVIRFDSEVGKGTVFQLFLPLTA
ncbi:MAG: PAS domain S-box protein [Candidatus Omnitrophica bacterium]|nr:PAS domain S-box protein [Candidatus Omnitrophota bacterium]